MRVWPAASLAIAALGASLVAQEQPRFTAGVELTSVDVVVVDQNGNPITDLKPDEFVIRIDNAQRKIMSAEWVSAAVPAAPVANADAVPEGYSSNETETGGRLIVIAVDEANLRFGGGRAIIAAAGKFVDALKPTDRIAAVGIGTLSVGTSFTADRTRVKATLARMTGKADSIPFTDHRIALIEATQIADGDVATLDRVIARECQGLTGGALELCTAEVEQGAQSMAIDARRQGDEFIRGLRDLLRALRPIDAPKTLVLISNGFVSRDTAMEVPELASAATAARTTIYALHLDRSFVDVEAAHAPVDPFGDDRERSVGLEMLVSASRGAIFQVAGTGENTFKRIEAEIAGYYLVGVESDPRDRDGRMHQIKVDVTRRGSVLRARRQFVLAPPVSAPSQAQQALVYALASPLPVSGLPMRAITFTLQGPERDKVQLLIHAEVGNGYTAPTPLSAGFVLRDATGRIVDTRLSKTTLVPTLAGSPSPLVYVAGASVAPGEYTLKVAAADGTRAGSVEHPVHAVLPNAGAVVTSDLIVGSSLDSRPQTRPVVSSVAWYGTMQGYMEIYGSAAATARVRYEVAADDNAPALASVNSEARQAGDGRTIFAGLAVVGMIPPGQYRMRAIVTTADASVTKLSRAFTIPSRAPRPVPTLDPGSGEVSASVKQLFLPVSEAAIAPPFDINALVSPGVVSNFLDQWVPDPPPSPATAAYLKAARSAPLKDVPPAPPEDDAFGWFVRGLAFLQRHNEASAEESFKNAMSDLTDTTVPLVYLAATFAAAGHDQQAAAAWVTALATNDELPEIYQWAAEASLRIHDVQQAQSLLEEAAQRWPDDVRWARPLAILYATVGRGQDAIAQLERHLGAHPDDQEALKLAVRWLFELHSAGASAHPDDLSRARQYAEAYQKLGGGDLPLVQRWVEFLEREKR